MTYIEFKIVIQGLLCAAICYRLITMKPKDEGKK